MSTLSLAGVEVRVVVEAEPGERLAQAIRHVFLAAQDGRTDARGRLRPLHAAVVGREFADVVRFTSPPWLVQRVLFGLLAPWRGPPATAPPTPPTWSVSCPWSTWSRSRPRPPSSSRPRRPADQEQPMNYDQVRDLLVTQWTYTGGPNEARAADFYHDDAVLEFPQSGERFRGRDNFTAWRQQYPARLEFEPRELRGSGDLWVVETGLRYDGGDPVSVVKILQFRGDRIERETLYFADPFPPPDWRRPYADEGDAPERRGGLPASVAAGS